MKDRQVPTYILSYPRPVRLIRAGVLLLLAVSALVTWVLAWIAFAGPAVQAALATTAPLADTLRLFARVVALQPWRPLLAAHVGLLLTVWALVVLVDLLPDLALADDGLAVRRLRRWSTVPWSKVKAVRIVSLDDDRHLVLVQGRWTRLAAGPRLASLLMGAGAAPGVLFTSQIRDFMPLVERLYQEVKAAAPEAVFDDEFFSLPALLVLAPGKTLASLVDQAREEGWTMGLSFQAMAAVAGGLVVVQLLFLLLHGGLWWASLAIVALCAVEWLSGTLYFYALAEVLGGRVEFRTAALLYPIVQIPRALLTVPMAMLVTAGIDFLAAAVGLIGVVWAVVLTALLVQRLYYLKSLLPAAAGAVFQVLFQFLIVAIAFSS